MYIQLQRYKLATTLDILWKHNYSCFFFVGLTPAAYNIGGVNKKILALFLNVLDFSAKMATRNREN